LFATNDRPRHQTRHGNIQPTRHGSPPPDEVAAEIVERLETALDRFRNVAKALGEGPI
jgi:hypothetical protein